MTRPAVHRRSRLLPALMALVLWGPVACTAGSTAAPVDDPGPSAAPAPATATPATSTPLGTVRSDRSDATTPATPATSASPPATTTDATVPRSTNASAQKRTSPVDSAQHTYVDTERSRSLLTTMYWPTDAGGTDPTTVVLIAHGYSLPGWGYDRLARQLAGAGYVVGVPDFPHTSGVVGDGNRADIVNQPADLSFVADRVIGGRLPTGAAAPWPRLDAGAKVAIVGHSDGGLTATAFAYNDRYRDLRVFACVSLTGGIALFPGSSFTPRPDGAPQPPLLAVHGTADETNPASASTNLFAAHPGGAGSPKHLVLIDGGSHLGPFMFATASADLGALVAEFIDRSRAGDASRMRVSEGSGLTIRSG